MDSPWLNCAKACNWWVHTRCVGVSYKISGRWEKQLDSWAKDHYFCQKHMHVGKSVECDPVNQYEFVVAQHKKNYLKKALKRKVNS